MLGTGKPLPLQTIRAVRLLKAVEEYVEHPLSRKRFRRMKQCAVDLRDMFPKKVILQVELEDHFAKKGE